jgi:hypothetical protein
MGQVRSHRRTNLFLLANGLVLPWDLWRVNLIVEEFIDSSIDAIKHGVCGIRLMTDLILTILILEKDQTIPSC